MTGATENAGPWKMTEQIEWLEKMPANDSVFYFAVTSTIVW